MQLTKISFLQEFYFFRAFEKLLFKNLNIKKFNNINFYYAFLSFFVFLINNQKFYDSNFQ